MTRFALAALLAAAAGCATSDGGGGDEDVDLDAMLEESATQPRKAPAKKQPAGPVKREDMVAKPKPPAKSQDVDSLLAEMEQAGDRQEEEARKAAQAKLDAERRKANAARAEEARRKSELARGDAQRRAEEERRKADLARADRDRAAASAKAGPDAPIFEERYAGQILRLKVALQRYKRH